MGNLMFPTITREHGRMELRCSRAVIPLRFHHVAGSPWVWMGNPPFPGK